MPSLKELSQEKISKYPDKVLAIVHADLHKWYDKGVKAVSDLLTLFHNAVFIEFVLRGLHHKQINKLDDIATPTLPSNIISDVISDSFEPKSYSDLASKEKIIRHHAAIHNIWFSVKISEKIQEPNEELYNAHDVVVREMSHHPNWDELDLPWENELKLFRVIKDEKIIHLSQILAGFPDDIVLVSGAVYTSDRDVYITPGIDGTLLTIMSLKILREVSQSKIIDIQPNRPSHKYDLVLVRTSLLDQMNPISKDEKGFASAYSLSSNFVSVVGSVADQTVSLNDVDILVKRGTPDWLYQHIISLLIINHPRMYNLHILRDQGLGPTATFVPLYNLFLLEV